MSLICSAWNTSEFQSQEEKKKYPNKLADSFWHFYKEVKNTFQSGEPFHLSVTFPLARLLFLPCLVLVALRMLTCFLSHSLIWHDCEASPPMKVMPLWLVSTAWELSEKLELLRDCGESLFLHVIYFKSHAALLHCRQLFLRRKKKTGMRVWMLQKHPPVAFSMHSAARNQ